MLVSQICFDDKYLNIPIYLQLVLAKNFNVNSRLFQKQSFK